MADPTSPDGGLTEGNVLVGKDGWLFLQNDNNDVIGQHTGEVQLGPERRAGWEAFLRARREMVDDLGIASVSVIAPDKEAVYADYLPDEVTPAARRPVHEVLEAANAAGAHMVYPLADLEGRKGGRPLYSVTGTHWSGVGAYVAYRVICRELGQMGVRLRVVRRDAIVWQKFETEDDLGSKLSRPLTGATFLADIPDEAAAVVFDNRIINHGRVVVFERPDGFGPTGVVHGESFTNYLLRFLKEDFARLVFVHTSAPAREILELERPDVLISVPTERFLIRVPNHEKACSEFMENVELKRRSASYHPIAQVGFLGRNGADVSQEGELPWDLSVRGCA